MASSSFPVHLAASRTNSSDAQDSQQPRSHSDPNVVSVLSPPPGPGRKRSYGGGSQSDPGGAADRDARPSESDAHHQFRAEAGSRLPSLDTPESTDAADSSKKRKTAKGSRGVANLTPEQLERKRANDREAQRAIRERQRLRTEQYERQIAELKSTRPYQELQNALRQKEAVEAELADLKRCMAAIVSMIQPVLGRSAGLGMSGDDAPVPPGRLAQGLTGAPADQSCQSSFHGHPLTQPLTASSTHNSASTPTSATSPASVGTHGRWQSSLSPVAPPASVDGQHPQPSPEMALLHQQRCDLAHGLDLGSDKLGLHFLIEPNLKIARMQSGVNGAQDSPKYRHVPMKHDWTASMSMMPGMQGAAQPQQPTQSPIYSQPPVPGSGVPPLGPLKSQVPSPSSRSPSLHSLVPSNCPPTCPLDSILLDFLAERRQRAAEGLSQSEIIGPRYPSVSSLLNPAVSAYSHPLSKVFTDILARFPDLSSLPERVAVLYLMFLLMRWQVAPTEENYLRLPAWFRPVRNQIEKEHPAWLDHLPFPKMREKLVAEYEPGEFPFDNFFIPFTTTLSLNWPYEDAYVLLASPTGEELMINPVFEQHLAELKNWTLGPAFETAFPQLTGCYNLKIRS
ncbi:hypothetical protein N657DRAFT_647277 [Parathielavia appendiculata]|uniref:BZIP transcription factor n=1 Tax=Parathielavia appendiculata TaxID=2587402 RepID=A0AAN6Z179_9PEZI|nr:hypothetical protein N657DRAFT_647277 [Parathielavia appendiculata]